MKKFSMRALTPLAILFLIISACGPADQPTSTNQYDPTSTLISTQTEISETETLTNTPQEVEATGLSVQSFPAADNYSWKLIASGLNRPVGLTHAGDNSERLFFIEQAGVILVFDKGSIRPDPFLDIRERVGSSGNEQGLLGLAFHPEFSKNGAFYVNYTNLQGNTIIARFTADINAPVENQAADLNSEIILMQIEQPFSNHNGGDLKFGPDEMLWIGLGDGGSGGDPQGNGQSTQTLLGKLLRINVDDGNLYGIPADNPFSSGGGLPEIWGYGLRNPWCFSFDSLTGDLFIADVGQNQWEEVNFLPYGYSETEINFGWNLREGTHQYQNRSVKEGITLIEPIFEYGHDLGCSISGGEVYRGQTLPEFYGIYLFGDFCSGSVWGLIQIEPNQWQGQLLFETGLNISSFGLDEDGEIYLVDLNGGIYRLELKENG